MERYGYDRDSSFCFVNIYLEEEGEAYSGEFIDVLGKLAERIARNIREQFLSFHHKESLILVLVNYTETEIETFVKEFIAIMNKHKKRV